jgi:hypothetical protein
VLSPRTTGLAVAVLALLVPTMVAPVPVVVIQAAAAPEQGDHPGGLPAVELPVVAVPAVALPAAAAPAVAEVVVARQAAPVAVAPLEPLVAEPVSAPARPQAQGSVEQVQVQAWAQEQAQALLGRVWALEPKLAPVSAERASGQA